MGILDRSTPSENVTLEQQRESSARALSVLFLDSDIEQASSTCASLRRAGLTAAAADSTTAVQVVATQRPHIVLLGSMPYAEGISLCRAIKQVLPDVIVLVYTAQPEAWQLTAESIAGVVPPCKSCHELVEEICAWIAHSNICCGDQELRDRLARLRLGCGASD